MARLGVCANPKMWLTCSCTIQFPTWCLECFREHRGRGVGALRSSAGICVEDRRTNLLSRPVLRPSKRMVMIVLPWCSPFPKENFILIRPSLVKIRHAQSRVRGHLGVAGIGESTGGFLRDCFHVGFDRHVQDGRGRGLKSEFENFQIQKDSPHPVGAVGSW